MYQKVQASSGRKTTNKFIAGIAAFAAAGIITASGLAGAAPMSKPSKDDCQKAGFSNYGQCVKEWAQNKPEPGNGGGNGYGGSNTSVATNINVNLNNSNNNIIQIFVRIFE